MRNIKKIVLLVIALFFTFALVPNFVHADTSVGNEATLRSAIDNATSGEVITLSTNIVLTSPIEIVNKNITINGNGFTITRAAEGWSADGQNATLITAGKTGTRLNLMNVKLIAAEKYGVQSYSGAYVSLDNVTISDCGYGGVLVNAGTVEVKNLILNRNGNPNNNGIEIAKGTGVYEEGVMPKLIMNGSISSTETENVIYLAINDNLAEFSVSNTPTSQDKIYVSDKRVIVADANNNIKFQSNENSKAGVEIEGDTYVPNEPTPEPEQASNSNDVPKTGDNDKLGLSILMFVVSGLAIVVLNKKWVLEK